MEMEEYVKNILNDIKSRGIEAVIEYAKKFDGYGEPIKVSEDEFIDAKNSIPDSDKKIIEGVYNRIFQNHAMQFNNDKIRFFNGSIYGIKYSPIERIGMYIPGKKPLPSTVMMIGIPARIAGVKDIVIASAPEPNGKVNPYTLYIATLLGIHEVYRLGGIQAIGSMAYGKGMERVDKIFGPGNSYVNEAKRQVYGFTGIDGLYGPSEVMIITDGTGNNEYIISDLNSQLEHGETSKAWLLTTGKPPKIDKNSRIKIMGFNNMDELVDTANEIAPEHMEIQAENAMEILNKIKNAGAIYIGDYAPVPAGDYFLGVNHLLPTGTTSRFSSALTVDDFMKKTSFANVSRSDFMENRELGMGMARIEGMPLHYKSMEVRS
jgi:histidinol dehydrogenase